MTSLSDVVDVVIGVDTHVNTHSAAVVDARTGAVLAERTVRADPAGYDELIGWADTHSGSRAWAIEGTASHGRGLATRLGERTEIVVEVDRPQRTTRRMGEKSDPLDAVRAARDALSRTRLAAPRAGGDRQALSVLLAARRAAVDAATVAREQLFSLVVAAPEVLRAKFRGRSGPARVTVAAALRIPPSWDVETATTARVLRELARRTRTLLAEAARHQKHITTIVRSWRPELLAQTGVGPIVAATVLCAWSHPGRIHSEGAFAKLGGAAPIPATSGQVVTRYRLSRYGDRQLNQALHTIAVTRLRHDPATQAYHARRTRDGKTPREIKRCLKRYIARDLYRLLENPPQPLDKP